MFMILPRSTKVFHVLHRRKPRRFYAQFYSGKDAHHGQLSIRGKTAS
jgi:hypothetical protein